MADLKLRVTGGVGVGRLIPLSDQMVLGRDVPGEGRIDDEALSRSHIQFRFSPDGSVTVDDLGSLNGTRVNGERIAGPEQVRIGDTIELGRTSLLVVDDSGSGSSARTSDTVLVGRPAPTPRAEPAAPRPPRAPLSDRLPAIPPVAILAVLGAAVLVVLAVLLAGGGSDGNKAGAPRSVVQLTVGRSGVTSAVARTAPDTAPPQAGTGVLVDADRGLVLTADTLVSGAKRIAGRAAAGPDSEATLVTRAPCEGVALVRVPGLPDGMRAASSGNAEELDFGDRVTALAFPGTRRGGSVPRGLRTTRGRLLAGPSGSSPSPADPALPAVVAHDARTGSGAVGGPLLGPDGRVVGLGTTQTGRRGTAIAFERVRAVYRELISGRAVANAGWRLVPWSAILGRPAPGLLVTGVDAGAPATDARLPRGVRARRPGNPLLGATIYAVQGRSVSDVADVCGALRGNRRGSRVRVQANVNPAGVTSRPPRSGAVTVRMRL